MTPVILVIALAIALALRDRKSAALVALVAVKGIWPILKSRGIV